MKHWVQSRLWPELTLNGAVVLLIISAAFFSFVSAFHVPLLTIFPRENAHFSLADTAWVYGIYGTCAPIMAIGMAYPLDRLPAMPLVFLAACISMAVRLAIPFLPALTTPGTVFVLAIVMPMSDVLFNMATTLALKRLVYGIFAGDNDLAKERLEHLIYVLYAVSNFMDVLANVTYDYFLHVGGPAQATRDVSWLSAGVILAMLFFIQQAWRTTGRVDHPVTRGDRESIWALTLRSGTFWRFTSLGILLSGVRMVFRHLDFTLVQWFIAVLGPASHYALVQSINPAMICVLTPLVPFLFRRIGALRREHDSNYSVLMIGTSMCALSPLVLAYALEWGLSPYVAAVLGVVVFSLGEATWSPQFLQYSLQVAPVGSEALFSALANIPALAIRLPAAYLSNVLLSTFCPGPGPQHCDGASLWWCIGIIAATTPLGLMALQRVLREPGRGSNNVLPTS